MKNSFYQIFLSFVLILLSGCASMGLSEPKIHGIWQVTKLEPMGNEAMKNKSYFIFVPNGDFIEVIIPHESDQEIFTKHSEYKVANGVIIMKGRDKEEVSHEIEFKDGNLIMMVPFGGKIYLSKKK